MIVSESIKIPRVEKVSTEYIENELKKQNIIDPIRWAITDVNDENLIITLAYERE